ncbi:MAG: hypothetical protein ACOCVK_02990, partial [bacterium]
AGTPRYLGTEVAGHLALEQDPNAVYGDKDIFDDLAEPMKRRKMKRRSTHMERDRPPPARSTPTTGRGGTQGSKT